MTGQIEAEHLHRYFLAREFCRGKDVLDVAAGEGYGAAILAQVAHSVIGVELSAEVVAHSTNAYRRPNLSYLQGDARKLSLPDGSVDVVVSFETIEHFREQEDFLAEVRRVLRPDGVALISSPNKDVYSPEDSRVNPYHVKELTCFEFTDLIGRFFRNQVVLLQRPLIGSAIMPDMGPNAACANVTFERRGEDYFEQSPSLPRALYAISIASDAPVTGVFSSLYIETSHVDLLNAWAGEARQARAEAEGAQSERDEAAHRADVARAAVIAAETERDAVARALATAQSEAIAAETERDAVARALATAQSEAIAAETERDAVARALATAQSEAIAVFRSEQRQAALGATQELANAHSHIHCIRRQLGAALNQMAAERDHAVRELDALRASASWRHTAPLRHFVFQHPRTARYLRKLLRTVWWTVTLQLPLRLRQHRGLTRKVQLIAASGLFDTAWYSQQSGLQGSTKYLIRHYLSWGWREGLDPNPLFSTSWYIASNPDIGTEEIPLVHYLVEGAAQGRDPNRFFKSGWYLDQNVDVCASSANPLAHYLHEGARAGRAPSPDFDAAWYTAHNPDVQAGEELPLVHYLRTGAAEKRMASPRSRQLRRDQQAIALGRNIDVLPARRPVFGIVTYNNTDTQLRRVLRSCVVALRQANASERGSILLIHNGDPVDAALEAVANLCILPSRGNVGFGAGHNILMAAAFAEGADAYIAVNPDGMLHPNALAAMLRMSEAARGCAIIEAMQVPDEHPKIYDLNDFETPWASGACMLLPRRVWESIGGFDDRFFMYCEDVDISWRARAAGFGVKTCAPALFLHPTSHREIDPEQEQRYLVSGLLLASKWGSSRFAVEMIAEMERRGYPPPDMSDIRPVPAPAGVPDFDHLFSFAPTRW